MAWTPRLEHQSEHSDLALPDGWLRCDGSRIPQPSIWAGKKSPDLNSEGRFLRGGYDRDALLKEGHMIQGEGEKQYQLLKMSNCLVPFVIPKDHVMTWTTSTSTVTWVIITKSTETTCISRGRRRELLGVDTFWIHTLARKVLGEVTTRRAVKLTSTGLNLT